MGNKEKIRVLFNDSHVNLNKNKLTPQGGPSRFANLFAKYFDKKNNIELISILFTHCKTNENVYTRKTKQSRIFHELVYPRHRLLDTYKKDIAKVEYIKYLQPWLESVKKILDESKPDIVFLNGFGLTNWLLLESAYDKNIPIVVQHAGIWKKELISSSDHFSKSIRRLFSSFEKEIVKKANHQIFLNEFSKKEFFKLHNTKITKEIDKNISVIPLPLQISKVNKIQIKKEFPIQVGIVARWDKIKNHSAVFRLAKYFKNQKSENQINVVTKWSIDLKSNFKDKYEKEVNITAPMMPIDLRKFYKKQDIILIPSRFDVSPTVLMEAVIEGKPVIISDQVGWVSDYRDLGLSELTFPYTASGQTINEKINEMIKNRDQFLPKFVCLQNKIVKEHNSDTVFEQYYQLFKKVYDFKT